MKRTKLIALIAAVIFMLFLGIWVLGKGSSGEKVIVANKEIQKNTIIKSEDLKSIDTSKDAVPENACLDEKEIVGKMSNSNIYKGEVIVKNRLITKGKGNVSYGLASVIAKGKRGMSVAVSYPQGVSALLKVGNKVDIVFSGKSNSDSGYTKMFLQNVKILALDSDYRGVQAKDDKSGKAYKTVTLELSPKEFLELVYAIKNGEVWLALRPQVDKESVKVPVVTGSDLK